MDIKAMETEMEINGKAYVHWKAWQEAYAGLLPADYLESRSLDQCRKWAFAYPENTLVAILDNQVVGFACYGRSSQEDLLGAGELYALYVLADYYDQQIGYSLMQEALKKMQSYDTICLWVLEGNARAISFYQKVGFRFDGMKKTVKLGDDRIEYRMIFHRKNEIDSKI